LPYPRDHAPFWAADRRCQDEQGVVAMGVDLFDNQDLDALAIF
jgi:hypothetical protein